MADKVRKESQEKNLKEPDSKLALPSLTEIHLQSLKSLLQLLLAEVEFLENLTPRTPTSNGETPLARHLEIIEIELIRNALHETEGNQARAAKILSLRPNTLLNKLRRLGIDPRLFVRPAQSGDSKR